MNAPSIGLDYLSPLSKGNHILDFYLLARIFLVLPSGALIALVVSLVASIWYTSSIIWGYMSLRLPRLSFSDTNIA